MPIYEYECRICGHLFDEMRRVSESDVATCPECGDKKAKKLISAPAFHLKGTGWYATDFKDKKPAQDKKETKEKSDTNGDKKKKEDNKKTDASTKKAKQDDK